MSIFQCENCGCAENTALASTGFKLTQDHFDWSYAPHLKGKLLCSACGPTKYRDGTATEYGVWHRRFQRTYFPMGEFETNQEGNLVHKETKMLSGEFAFHYPTRMHEAAKEREGL